MRLISEVIVNVKKGMFPQLVFDIYKCSCDVQNIEFLEEVDKDEQFKLEILYSNRNNFLKLIDDIDGFPERYGIVSVANALEEKITGGLLNISGKLPLENLIDYEVGLLGAADFISGKIAKGDGFKYCGISKNIGIIGCVKVEDESSTNRLLMVYSSAERDSVIISRFTGLNPIPLVISFNQPDDLIKSIQSIEKSFSAIRLVDIDGSENLVYDQIYSNINIPVSSNMFDDAPLYLLTLLKKIISMKKLKAEEITVGIAGINVTAFRCARIFLEAGFYRVLGCDNNEKQMLTFENNGGLATTVDNIFSNADIVILLKECFDDDSIQKIRPGVNMISLLEDEEIDITGIKNRGVREFINVEKSSLLVLLSGIVKGVMDSGENSFTDSRIIEVSSKLSQLMTDDYKLPDILSSVHDKIYEYIV